MFCIFALYSVNLVEVFKYLQGGYAYLMNYLGIIMFIYRFSFLLCRIFYKMKTSSWIQCSNCLWHQIFAWYVHVNIGSKSLKSVEKIIGNFAPPCFKIERLERNSMHFFYCERFCYLDCFKNGCDFLFSRDFKQSFENIKIIVVWLQNLLEKGTRVLNRLTVVLIFSHGRGNWFQTKLINCLQ